jgi:hypothetical protein
MSSPSPTKNCKNCGPKPVTDFAPGHARCRVCYNKSRKEIYHKGISDRKPLPKSPIRIGGYDDGTPADEEKNLLTVHDISGNIFDTMSILQNVTSLGYTMLLNHINEYGEPLSRFTAEVEGCHLDVEFDYNTCDKYNHPCRCSLYFTDAKYDRVLGSFGGACTERRAFVGAAHSLYGTIHWKEIDRLKCMQRR